MMPFPRIVVVGLGYVGLPLAIALAGKFAVTGLDIDRDRIDELLRNHDRTREVEAARLEETSLKLTAEALDCAGADIYIVTVPTPVDKANQPDLAAVLAATRTVAELIDPEKRPTIIYESTVYPGVTEEICGPEIERLSGLRRGRDFRLGYSPERINPGDREHTIDRITKVVAGEDDDVTAKLVELYGAITSGGVFAAASIKAAETAKAIENAQRDINIAFMNEVAKIVAPIGVSVWDVLDAAKTKWNFLPFEPGLVGGHCIGVDPYYLSYLARRLGHNPQVILAGRETNDGMGAWVADQLHARRGKAGRVLVMGVTFKENVPDLRNSRVFDVVERLIELGHDVTIVDPLADPAELHREHGLGLSILNGERYDLVVAAVPHREFREMSDTAIASLVAAHGTLADLKGMWRERMLPHGIDVWTL
ncbi:MAG TPA: nucleotide sugar dehydrogenase [Sphingomicrobium sp.]|nr:nucleotide sugar dehydrogenase [Sphingomicrobium sp.]